MDTKRAAAAIANEALRTLREQGLDCVERGGYYDCSQKIHTAVLHAARDILEAKSPTPPEPAPYGVLAAGSC